MKPFVSVPTCLQIFPSSNVFQSMITSKPTPTSFWCGRSQATAKVQRKRRVDNHDKQRTLHCFPVAIRDTVLATPPAGHS
ncbi:uncharacterized protein PHALS_05951 [Plasmopara halstedii]|uniref:Uncharacterized protein n=1 Tax=Plasmopara halstedii TaxID=4781 RepID=A0A0P1ABN4_PLAHL|nr:uncharacterized protein PHALS_05951 [Plasmopara halstedii]CEG37903.1 hypothetical protein PHALS_05951 [Plasmopara halstedii]|eukprot:XP_024574272.1 hypothetical protein PHALS_05951 [Plasmopara halstedii]